MLWHPKRTSTAETTKCAALNEQRPVILCGKAIGSLQFGFWQNRRTHSRHFRISRNRRMKCLDRMAPERWCQIARAGIEKNSNPVAAISAHLSKLPELPKKKAVRFDGLLIQTNAAYLISPPSHKEASLQVATFSSSSSISWSLDNS